MVVVVSVHQVEDKSVLVAEGSGSVGIRITSSVPPIYLCDDRYTGNVEVSIITELRGERADRK